MRTERYSGSIEKCISRMIRYFMRNSILLRGIWASEPGKPSTPGLVYWSVGINGTRRQRDLPRYVALRSSFILRPSGGILQRKPSLVSVNIRLGRRSNAGTPLQTDVTSPCLTGLATKIQPVVMAWTFGGAVL